MTSRRRSGPAVSSRAATTPPSDSNESSRTAEAPVCSINDCGKPARSRGWCRMHYSRWQRHGDVNTTLVTRGPLEKRFWEKVDGNGPDGCWLWTGAVSDTGYGSIHADDDRRVLAAHRVAYELAYGPIPDGMMIDHRCHVRACVNPAHLRAATAKQNQENRQGARPGSISGERGVSWSAPMRKWEARVHHHGRTYRAGYFDSIAQAAEAAKAKRNELFTHNDADRVGGAA
jgi:hypothetical protein